MLHNIKLVFLCFLLLAGSTNIAAAETYIFQIDGNDVEINTTSFADSVVSYTAGANTASPYNDPLNSLGIPDEKPVSSGTTPLKPDEAVSLGDGGELILEFTDNAFTTSGDDTVDIWVFEVGEYVEGTEVSISKDGVSWISIGTIGGSTYGVDIDAYLGSGVELWEQYYFVKLKDLNNRLSPSPYAGADIDAVAAISNEVLIDSHTPVAVTGPDQTVPEGSTVTLDATGSYDPDDDPVTYLWEQISGTSVALSNNTDDQPTFTAPEVSASGGSLTFKLTVTDDGGLYSEASCIVNVTNMPTGNIPPVANAGSDQKNIVEGNIVLLDGSNSYDPDSGVIQSYAWTQISGVAVTLSNSSAVKPTFVAPYVGTSGDSLKFRLVVTDGEGLQSSDQCIVSVNSKNRSPIANAGTDQTFGPGDLVTLDGSGSSDPDTGDVIKYRWRQISGTTVILSDYVAEKPTFTAPSLTSDDVLYFELTVTDNGGLISVDTCIVNVMTGSNQPPIADAGPESATVAEGTTVTLNGSGSSDPDGDVITTYRWTEKSGPPVTLSNPVSVQPTFVAPEVGVGGAEIVFELIVEDDGGLQGSDTITVTITDVPTTPGSGDGGGGGGGGCFISTSVGLF